MRALAAEAPRANANAAWRRALNGLRRCCTRAACGPAPSTYAKSAAPPYKGPPAPPRTHQECARRARREQPRRERHAAPLQRAGTPRQASGSRLRSPALEHLHQTKGRSAWRCWTAFPRPRVRRVHFRHVPSRVPSTRPSRPRRLPASAMPPSGAHPSPSAAPCNNKKKARRRIEYLFRGGI